MFFLRAACGDALLAGSAQDFFDSDLFAEKLLEMNESKESILSALSLRVRHAGRAMSDLQCFVHAVQQCRPT